MSITAKQIRAARALLEWSQGKLVEETGLSLTTVRRMESEQLGPSVSYSGNVETVRAALEAAGVVFIAENGGGAGVRMARPDGSAA